MTGKKLAADVTINPHVEAFLTIYSQSERSTGGTRGYDARYSYDGYGRDRYDRYRDHDRDRDGDWHSNFR